MLEKELANAFAELSLASEQRNWRLGRLGIIDPADPDGPYIHNAPGQPGRVIVRRGDNGELGETTAINLGVALIDNLPVKMRRENGVLVIREVDQTGAGWAELPDDPDIPTGIGAPSPHTLGGAHHTGTLNSSQAPQFLLTSGARNLTGNLGVDTGITIDGVDLSVHAADPDAHHNRVTVGNTGLSLSTQVVSLNLATDPGLEISSGVRVKVDSTLVRDADGVGVDLTHDFVWGGDHTFNDPVILNDNGTFNTGVFTFNTDPQIGANLDFIGGDRSITASAKLSLTPTGDLLLDPTGLILLPTAQELRTETYNDFVAGIAGLRHWDTGGNVRQLTIGKLKADELHVRVFSADEQRVSRGAEFWAYGFGMVETEFVVPADEATVDVWFEEAPDLGSFKLFRADDWILFRTIDQDTGLLVQAVWFLVVDGDGAGANDWLAREDETDGPPPHVSRQQWRLRRKSGGFTGEAVKKGVVGVDFGKPFSVTDPTPGQGVVHLSALHEDGGPFVQIQTFESVLSDVPQFKNRVRMGNLTGTVDYSTDIYGFATGDDLSVAPSAGFSGITSDPSNGLRLFNTDLELFVSTTRTTRLNSILGLTFAPDTADFANPGRYVAWYATLGASSNTDLLGRIGTFVESNVPKVKIASHYKDTFTHSQVILYAQGSDSTPSFTLEGTDNATTGSATLLATTFTVSAATTFDGGDVEVVGNLEVGNDLTVDEDVIIGGAIGLGGVTSPTASIDIAGPNNVTRVRATSYGGAAYSLVSRRANNTVASPTQIATGNVVMTLGGMGYTDEGWAANTSGEISLRAVEDFDNGSDGSVAGEWVFHVNERVVGGLIQVVSIGDYGLMMDTSITGLPAPVIWKGFGGSPQYFAAGINLDGEFIIAASDTLTADVMMTIDPATGEITGNFGLVGGAGTETLHDAATGGDGIDITGTQTINVDATVVRTDLTLTAGAGMTGGGTLAANRTFNIGAGPGITVAADNIEIALASPSGLQLTSDVLAVADSIAGDGLVIASKILAVGAGDGISVTANAVALAGTVAGAGLTMTTGVLNVIAGDGIAVNANDVAVASSIAGAGLTFTTGVVAVGAGAGISVAADAVAIALGSNSALDVSSGLVVDSSIAGAGLTMTSGVVNVIALSTGGMTVNANDIQIKLPSPSGLVTDATGLYIDDAVAGAGLTMTSKVLNVIAGDGSLTVAANELHVNLAHAFTWSAVHTFTANPDIQANLGFSGGARSITGSGNITLAPTGDLILSPTGANVNPASSISVDLGDYNRLYKSIYAAELRVSTIVAQDIAATIGGRIWVGVTTTLVADLGSGAGDTTIHVKHNSLTNGDFVVLQTAPGGTPQLEVLKIASVAGGVAGDYTYTVVRDQDGTGRNAWIAGDGVFDTKNGYIDLASISTLYGQDGPTITIYDRTGTAAWNEMAPVASFGNLESLVDYGAETYGVAFGNDLTLDASTGFSGATVDATDGLRLFNTETEIYDGSNLVTKFQMGLGWNFEADDSGTHGLRWFFDLPSDASATQQLASINTYYSDLEDKVGLAIIAAPYTGDASGYSVIQMVTDGPAASPGQFTLYQTRATFDTDMSLGIGILDDAIPASKLHVKEDTATTTAAAGVTIEQDGAGDALLQFFLTAGQRWMVGIDNSDGDKFKIGDSTDLATSILTLDPATDYIGIGKTAPSSKLHIVGTNDATGGITLESSAGTDAGRLAIYPLGNTSVVVQKLSADGILRFRNSAAVDELLINDTGLVGIGLTTPTGKLHIDQASTTAAIPVIILDQADLSEEFIELVATSGAGNPIQTSALGAYSGKFRINVNGTYFYVPYYAS